MTRPLARPTIHYMSAGCLGVVACGRSVRNARGFASVPSLVTCRRCQQSSMAQADVPRQGSLPERDAQAIANDLHDKDGERLMKCIEELKGRFRFSDRDLDRLELLIARLRESSKMREDARLAK